ncbi:MAG: KamA family radical SAM protein [Desulfobacterales bacterium]|nr:KamA family radical SAM protein [Desulfobacterales bacterium]
MDTESTSTCPTEEAVSDNDEKPPGPETQLYFSPSIIPLFNQKGATVSSLTNLKSSRLTKNFRKKFYPNVSLIKWNDWHWQVGNRIQKIEQLEKMLSLSSDEKNGLEALSNGLPVGITPYYMSLLSPEDSSHALRRTVIPTFAEFLKMPEEDDDPLGEDSQSPVCGLVHRYPDRVLFLLTDFCSTYCRYCTRSRVVGHGKILPQKNRLQKAIDYIAKTQSIRDVLLSGGDPFTLSDERLNWILTMLRNIPHVEIIRIGTKVPAVLPQRITPNLVKMLKKHHPLFISVHFTHPDECTPEAFRATKLLANAGIPLGSQTVLLKGINDNVETMKSLMHNLLRMRVRPYYLYQCDPISGSSHFRTKVEKGLEVIHGLRGFTSGYAVPTYVIDAPKGGGKIPLMPNYVLGRDNEEVVMQNYVGDVYRYPDTMTFDNSPSMEVTLN